MIALLWFGTDVRMKLLAVIDRLERDAGQMKRKAASVLSLF
jgi:hypothetical protein